MWALMMFFSSEQDNRYVSYNSDLIGGYNYKFIAIFFIVPQKLNQIT